MIRLKLNDVEMVNTCIPMYRNTTVSEGERNDMVYTSMTIMCIEVYIVGTNWQNVHKDNYSQTCLTDKDYGLHIYMIPCKVGIVENEANINAHTSSLKYLQGTAF